jgi:hypothetical protein
MPGVVETTDTFAANQVITSTLMNNIIDQTLFTSTALANGTLALTAGQMKVATSGITSNELATGAVTSNAIASDAVTTAKIVDANVTTAKIADANVTTAKILDANVTPAKLAQPLTLATSQNSTSGTSIDFTSIPSWVKQIRVLFSSVSTSGTSNLLIQIGDSGGIETTGYASIAADQGASSAEITTGFVLDRINSASAIFKGSIVLNLITGTTFVSSGTLAYSDSTHGTIAASSGGTKTLSSTLDKLRITTVGGTDTFDAGVINIIYE